MDAEIRNRYRLRCAKLSEVLPRSERSLAMVRMTEKDWVRRFGTGTGFACAKLSEVLPRSERSLATVRMTIRLDAETWNRYRLRCAKLSEILQNCGRVAPFGQDDRFGGRVARFSVTDCVARFGQDDGSASVANVAAVLVYFFEPFC